ncbi:MAG: DciA family protein [Parvularculaceae bacterium]
MRPIRTRPARSGPPQISRYSATVLAALAKKTKFVDPALAANWPTIVGDEIARLCRPGRLTGQTGARTLEIIAPNGAAAAQAQLLTDEIIERANRFLGPGALTRIAIRQDGGRASSPSAIAKPHPQLENALDRMRASMRERGGQG